MKCICNLVPPRGEHAPSCEYATPKDWDKIEDNTLKRMCELWALKFGEKYPSKTINHHHYIRRRNLQRLLYDFAKMLEVRGTEESHNTQP